MLELDEDYNSIMGWKMFGITMGLILIVIIIMVMREILK